MQVTAKTVTPEQATIWLRFAKHGPLHRRRIRRFVRMLARGERLRQGPAFTRDGHIFEGAETLVAVAESGTATELFVATGLPPLARISRGSSRSSWPADCRTRHRHTEIRKAP